MSLWKFWGFGYKIGVISLFIFFSRTVLWTVLKSGLCGSSSLLLMISTPVCLCRSSDTEWIVEVPRHFPLFGSSLRFMIAGSVWSSIHSLFCFQHFGTQMRCQKSSWTSHLRFFFPVFFPFPLLYMINSLVYVIFDNPAYQMKQGNVRSNCGSQFWSTSS